MAQFDLDRRAFLKSSAFAVGSGTMGLLSSTALSAIDPHSHGGRIFHATHYGPFEGIVRDGRTGWMPTKGALNRPHQLKIER